MKQAEIKVGGRYVAEVSGALVTVRVTNIAQTPSGGSWFGCLNEKTGRHISVRSAQRFRSEIAPPKLGFDHGKGGSDYESDRRHGA